MVRRSYVLILGVVGLAALSLSPTWAQQGTPALAPLAPLNPALVRQAATDAGLASLTTIKVVNPPNLNEFIRPGQEKLAAQLGKALFWDVQVGSDGQACASCHFHAGADNRAKNQVNPGLKGNDKTFGGTVRIETAFDLEPSGEGATLMRYAAVVELGGLLGVLGESALKPVSEAQVSGVMRAIERRLAARSAG